MHAERRSSYRLALPPQTAFVEDPTSHAKAPLRALNAGGGAAAFAAADWWKDTQPLPMRFLLGEHAPFLANISLLGPASRSEGEKLLAFRLHPLRGSAMGTLSAFLCGLHATADPRLERLFSSSDHTLALDSSERAPTRSVAGAANIVALLRHYVVYEKVALQLHRPSPLPTISLTDVAMSEGGDSLICTATPELLGQIGPDQKHIFFFASPLALAWFHSSLTRIGDDRLAIAAPTVLFKSGFRCSRRVAPPWHHPLTAIFEPPYLCGERMATPILEVAGNGFAVEFDPRRDCLFPGQTLRRVQIDLPLGSVTLDCVLRMCRPVSADSQRVVGGFEVSAFASPEDHDRWLRCIIPALFPEVHLGEQGTVADAWSRLDRSGYLDLIEQPERLRLRRPFYEDWTRHAGHPAFRARFLLAHQKGEPVGVAAGNLIYPKTCLIHSGGVDKDAQHSGRVLKLAAATFLFAHAVADYSLMLFEAHKPINVVLFQRFVDQYTTRHDNAFDALTVYKWRAARTVPRPIGSPPQAVDVVSASDELLRELWRHQCATLSPIELDAYGWSPENGAMQQFSEQCARDGYERRRHVFFALDRGLPVGALIAETGSEGMNVFSLLNSCSIVLLSGSEGHRSDIVRALLARAVDFYRGAGKGAFLLLASPGLESRQTLHDQGFSYVAEGWRWLAAKRVIPAYISYLEDLSVVGRAEVRQNAATGRALARESA